MADRRMFSKRVVESGKMLKLPAKAQLLYFHLGMNADDDGVVEAYPVMAMMKADEDTLKRLEDSGFIRIISEDFLCFITNWRENNQIRSDRMTPSIYRDLLPEDIRENTQVVKQRADTKKKEKPEDSEWTTDGRPMDGQMTSDGQPMDATGKDSIGKYSVGKEETRISNDILVEKKDPENEQPVFIEIPVIGGKDVPIPESFATQMQELYPAIDVREEIRRAKAWLLANPRNAKKDWKRFINSWLSRAQDKARAPARPQGRVSKDYDPNASHSGEGYISVEF